MEELPKTCRCSQCFKIFKRKDLATTFVCRPCFNCTREQDDDDHLLEDLLLEDNDEDELCIKSQLMCIHDYIMDDKMGDALFLLGRIIGNLEKGDYLYNV